MLFFYLLLSVGSVLANETFEIKINWQNAGHTPKAVLFTFTENVYKVDLAPSMESHVQTLPTYELEHLSRVMVAFEDGYQSALAVTPFTLTHRYATDGPEYSLNMPVPSISLFERARRLSEPAASRFQKARL